MRINIYSQELTTEIQTEQVVRDTGRTYSAVRLILHSLDRLHHPPEDDDRSAVTFWLPRSAERREGLADAFERMADEIRKAPREEEESGK